MHSDRWNSKISNWDTLKQIYIGIRTFHQSAVLFDDVDVIFNVSNLFLHLFKDSFHLFSCFCVYNKIEKRQINTTKSAKAPFGKARHGPFQNIPV